MAFSYFSGYSEEETRWRLLLPRLCTPYAVFWCIDAGFPRLLSDGHLLSSAKIRCSFWLSCFPFWQLALSLLFSCLYARCKCGQSLFFVAKMPTAMAWHSHHELRTLNSTSSTIEPHWACGWLTVVRNNFYAASFVSLKSSWNRYSKLLNLFSILYIYSVLSIVGSVACSVIATYYRPSS